MLCNLWQAGKEPHTGPLGRGDGAGAAHALPLLGLRGITQSSVLGSHSSGRNVPKIPLQLLPVLNQARSALHSSAWHSTAQCNTAWHGSMWLSTARHGTAQRGVAWLDTARLGTARSLPGMPLVQAPATAASGFHVVLLFYRTFSARTPPRPRPASSAVPPSRAATAELW